VDSFSWTVNNDFVHGLVDVMYFHNELMVNDSLAVEKHLQHDFPL
jgi:hypothetical protein